MNKTTPPSIGKEEAVVSILERSGWRVKRSGENLSIRCPLAPYTPLHRSSVDGKPSMGIKVDVDSVLVNCFTCGFKAGQLSYLYRRLAHHHSSWAPAIEACEEMETRFLSDGLSFLKTQGYALPKKKSEEPLSESVWTSYGGVTHPYWETRGISQDTVCRWGCGYDAQKERVLIPVRDHLNRLWGAVGRSVSDVSHPKYLNYFDMSKGKHLLGAHQIGVAKSIVVVEGAFDAMKVEQALFEANMKDQYAVVALMGASMSSEQLKRITSIAYEVILAFDNDEAGQRGQSQAYEKLYQVLMTKKVRFGVGVKDFGDCSPLQVINLIEGSSII